MMYDIVFTIIHYIYICFESLVFDSSPFCAIGFFTATNETEKWYFYYTSGLPKTGLTCHLNMLRSQWVFKMYNWDFNHLVKHKSSTVDETRLDQYLSFSNLDRCFSKVAACLIHRICFGWFDMELQHIYILGSLNLSKRWYLIWETPFFVLKLLRSTGRNDFSCNWRKHVKASMSGWLVTLLIGWLIDWLFGWVFDWFISFLMYLFMSLLVICWFKLCGNRYIYIYIHTYLYGVIGIQHYIYICVIYLYIYTVYTCIHSSLSCFVFHARNLVVGAASGFVAQTVRKGGRLAMDGVDSEWNLWNGEKITLPETMGN